MDRKEENIALDTKQIIRRRILKEKKKRTQSAISYWKRIPLILEG